MVFTITWAPSRDVVQELQSPEMEASTQGFFSSHTTALFRSRVLGCFRVVLGFRGLGFRGLGFRGLGV